MATSHKAVWTLYSGQLLSRQADDNNDVIYNQAFSCRHRIEHAAGVLSPSLSSQGYVMSKVKWWKSERERNPRFVTEDMLTQYERDSGEGARINKWLLLADQILGNTDDDDPAPSPA